MSGSDPVGTAGEDERLESTMLVSSDEDDLSWPCSHQQAATARPAGLAGRGLAEVVSTCLNGVTAQGSRGAPTVGVKARRAISGLGAD